jgi:hypothetical protein
MSGKSFRYATAVLPWINPAFYRSRAAPCKKRRVMRSATSEAASLPVVNRSREPPALNSDNSHALLMSFNTHRMKLTIYDTFKSRQFALSFSVTR